MSIAIKMWRDPYDSGFSATRPSAIELKEGLTVLVGCNGAGKTTLIQNIHEFCREEHIPCHLFDNLSDGGNNLVGSVLSGFEDVPGDDMSLACSMFTSSEGETIRLHIARQSRLYKEFFESGYFKDQKYRIKKAFSDDLPETIRDARRFLLFDATDSGVSIDSIVDIRSLFDAMIDDAKSSGIELYIVISANEYELCRNADCFDVNAGKYIGFSDYEDYRSFIIKSRERKEKRIIKQIEWQKKQKAKEYAHYAKLKADTEMSIGKIRDRARSEDREITYREKWRIEELERRLNDFKRSARFHSFEELH